MRVALYARVSTESQQARGTIGSQLAVLRDRVGVEGRVGCWGGRRVLRRRPLRGPAGPARAGRATRRRRGRANRAGLVPVPGPARPRPGPTLAYQVIVLDELTRHGVSVRFTDAPPLDDDPQAKLLIQVQGVIAEYERAKIAERYRRGKLFRSRNGEVLAWRIPYGYRRRPRDAHARRGWRCSNPRPPSCGGSSTTTSTAGTPCARSSAGWAPTRSRPPTGHDRPRPVVETLHTKSMLSNPAGQRGLPRAALRQPHRSHPRPPPRAAQPPGSPPPRGLDPQRSARHHRRADLRGGRAGQPR